MKLPPKIKNKKILSRSLIIIGLMLIIAGTVAIILICNQQQGAEAEVGVTGSDDGGIHIGGFSISTAALAIIVGGIIAIIGILKGRNIQLKADGSVIVN